MPHGYKCLGAISEKEYTYEPFAQRASHKLFSKGWGGDCAPLASEHEFKTATREKMNAFVFSPTVSPFLRQTITTAKEYSQGLIQRDEMRKKQFTELGCTVEQKRSGDIYAERGLTESSESLVDKQIASFINYVINPKKYYHSGVVTTYMLEGGKEEPIHAMDFVKRGNEIIWFDANYGQIYFKNTEAFAKWFKAETTSGVLKHVFIQPGPQPLLNLFEPPDAEIFQERVVSLCEEKPSDTKIKGGENAVWLYHSKGSDKIKCKYAIHELQSDGTKHISIVKIEIPRPKADIEAQNIHDQLLKKMNMGQQGLSHAEGEYLMPYLIASPHHIAISYALPDELLEEHDGVESRNNNSSNRSSIPFTLPIDEDVPHRDPHSLKDAESQSFDFYDDEEHSQLPITDESDEAQEIAEQSQARQQKDQYCLEIGPRAKEDLYEDGITRIYIWYEQGMLNYTLKDDETRFKIPPFQLRGQLGDKYESFEKAVLSGNRDNLKPFLEYILDKHKHDHRRASLEKNTTREMPLQIDTERRFQKALRDKEARAEELVDAVPNKQYVISATYTNKHSLIYFGKINQLTGTKKSDALSLFDKYCKEKDSELILKYEEQLNKLLGLKLPPSLAKSSSSFSLSFFKAKSDEDEPGGSQHTHSIGKPGHNS
jgi:hypothetical protein